MKKSNEMDSIFPNRYYIVEQRVSGMSVMPFGFLTDEDASKAIAGFGKRKKYMKVVIGSNLKNVVDEFLGNVGAVW